MPIHNPKVHFIRTGKGQKKIIFLHGWGGSTTSFEKISSQIAERTHQESLSIDFPGFGKTQNPPEDGWDTAEYADHLWQWLQTEILTNTKIEDVNFYVHSFGGRVLIQLLKKHPELTGQIILTGSAGIKWPLSFRQKISIWLSKTFGKAKRLLPAKIQKFILCKIFGARDWGAVAPHLKATLKKVLDEDDFRATLPDIKNQALILWGAKDTITPVKSGQVFAEALPHNTFHVFPEGKHGLHYTHADEIVSLVSNFLK
jgi:pimeloyl-ACP methyl ester carboxylesterase